MHNAATHSAVSDALVALAQSTPDAVALDEARSAVLRARQWISASSGTARSASGDGRPAHLMSGALQDSPSGDARTNAWVHGVVLSNTVPDLLTTPILAAVIAWSDSQPAAQSEQVAAAVAVASQATTRLLDAIDSPEFRERWNVVSALGVLGATLAVSRLVGLDAGKMRHALGIAATQAAGLARNRDASMHGIEIGKAAADAIEATLLAKHGFTSAVASIDGRRGLAALMAYRFDASAITGESTAA